MRARITTEEWIRRANGIWGSDYDYSKVRYKDSKTHVIVVCPKHGPWQCQPTNHTKKLKPRGCPKCGRERQRRQASKGFEAFVADARKVHGDRYEYPVQEYRNSVTKVQILCQEHGDFWQTPGAHLDGGQGCPKCGRRKIEESHRWTEARLNEKLAQISGGLVCVVPGTYRNQNTKATFRCEEHGEFQRLPNSALRGVHPCLKCGDTTRYSSGLLESDIRHKIRERFGKKYEVRPFIYKNQESKLTLVCSEHGEFTIRYASIHRSPGCRRCAHAASQENRTRGLLKQHASARNERAVRWLEAAKEFHGERFDYSKVKYENARKGVTIICPEHGEFRQAPYIHLKSGCRKCADEELKGRFTEKYFIDFPEQKQRRATLYYVRFESPKSTFYKVGVTSTSIRQRFILVKRAKITYQVLAELRTSLYNAFKLEQEIQASHGAKFRCRPELEEELIRRTRIGPSECFSKPLPKATEARVFH